MGKKTPATYCVYLYRYMPCVRTYVCMRGHVNCNQTCRTHFNFNFSRLCLINMYILCMHMALISPPHRVHYLYCETLERPPSLTIPYHAHTQSFFHDTEMCIRRTFIWYNRCVLFEAHNVYITITLHSKIHP